MSESEHKRVDSSHAGVVFLLDVTLSETLFSLTNLRRATSLADWISITNRGFCCYEALPDIWPFIQRACIWTSEPSSPWNDDVVFKLVKCLPQKCQTRHAESVFVAYIKPLYTDQKISARQKNERRSLCAWALGSLLGYNQKWTSVYFLSVDSRRAILRLLLEEDWKTIALVLSSRPFCTFVAVQEAVALAIASDKFLQSRMRLLLNWDDYVETVRANAGQARRELDDPLIWQKQPVFPSDKTDNGMRSLYQPLKRVSYACCWKRQTHV